MAKHGEHESIPRPREADGLLAYYPGEPLDGEREFTMISVWRDVDALRSWAGDGWEHPVLYGEAASVVEAVSAEHYRLVDAAE